MKKTSLINVVLIVVLMTSLVTVFSIIISKQVYETDKELLEQMLKDSLIENYFTDVEITYSPKSLLDDDEQEAVLSPMCTDCDNTVTTMYNSKSMYIRKAPEEYCDVDVERCILYVYDPFGIGLFEQKEIIRNKK